MIILNENTQYINIPIHNRCYYYPTSRYFLWLKNTYTKDLFFFRIYNVNAIIKHRNFLYVKSNLHIQNFIPHGEYEYYLTPDNPKNLYIDINNIQELESDVFYAGKLQPVFDLGNLTFAEKGCNESNCYDLNLFRKMRLISHGLLQYSKNTYYYEPDKETGYYRER